MKQKIRLAVLLFHSVLAAGVARAGDVIINEIMFHPAPDRPEQTRLEWIELYNKGTNTVDLDGWQFTRGISFRFTNVTMASHGYLVVASDRLAFLTRYPAVGNVAGDWAGVLGNNGDGIRLADAAGQTQNEVAYASEGTWATRVRGPSQLGHNGWAWECLADGQGRSLELINPNLPNSSGQNWSSSLVQHGTPGAANSTFANETAPLILDAIHTPLVPHSTDPVTITARVVDESGAGLSVILFHRLDANPQGSPFSAAPMLDDGQHGDGVAGDGYYGVTLPARANNTVVEFYIQASDSGANTRTYPAAARQLDGVTFSQTCNMLYQVDDSVYSGPQPFYRVILTEAERTELDQIGANVGGAANSDAAMSGTFISSEGNSSEARYNTSFRNRGHGSRTSRPNNIRIEFPNETPWHGVRAFNLNSRFPQCQVFGAALFQKAGLPMAASRAVQARVNNTPGLGGSPLFGSYAHNEELASEFAAGHFPLDASGNLYRGTRIDSPSYHADFTYLGPDKTSCVTAPNCYTNLYFKQSNLSADDFSDVIELCRVLSDAGLAGTQYLAEAGRVLDIDVALLYFACNTLADNSETSLSNGNGDDYAMYRGVLDTRFKLMGYDVDTIFGQGDTLGSTSASLFRMTNATVTMRRFITHPEIVPRYYAILKHLCETTFSPAQFEPLIDRVLGDFASSATISSMKGWNAGRCAFVLSRIPTDLTITSPLTVVSNFLQTTSPNASLSGLANIIETRSVQVNGSTATWNQMTGQWSLSAVPLNPGINRILVQTFGANGIELTRGTIDIWYDDASVAALSGTLASDLVLTAAGGPYRVTGILTVPAGRTLAVDPGATVYFASGAGITINGVLIAEGSDTQRIRFTKVPGSVDWGSLNFINSSIESRLSYLDIDSAAGASVGGQTAKIHVNNSVVFFDHLAFASTPAVTYVSFDASSFLVENSAFATYPAPAVPANGQPDMVRGVNGIRAGGYGIFRDNKFGRTYGVNDTIHFSGGNRPAAILQILNNVFDGGGDDQLALESADAWIEGNIFMHVHRDTARIDDPGDTANAISGGVTLAGQYPEWTILNNLFYDVDHAVLNKQGGRFFFVNNSVVHVAKENGGGLPADIAAFNFTDNNLSLPHPDLGAGAYIAGNIIWDCPALTANYDPAHHTVIFENNLLPSPWTGPGTGNVIADPRLNLGVIADVANADGQTVRAALTPRAGSPALGTGLGGKYDRGGLNPKGLLIYGEPAGVTPLNSANLFLGPGATFNWGTNAYAAGYTHYKWELDDGPWSGETSLATLPSIDLTGLADGTHAVHVVGRSDAGSYQDDTFVYPPDAGIPAHVTLSRAWTVDTVSPRLRINEVLARNTTMASANGEFPDLIELYNPGATVLDIAGFGITDDPANPFKFRFPPGASMDPGTYLLLYADNESSPGLHLGFALNQSGDSVHLYHANSNLVDEVVFGPQLANLSIGRLGDGNWGLTEPTFPGPNVVAPVGETGTVKINEWLASGFGLFGEDFIELYNPDSLPVDLGAHYISDAPQGSPTRHQFPPFTFIPANGFGVFLADGKPQNGGDHLSFHLSSDWGQLGLWTPGLELIDCVAYGPQFAGVSEGRRPTGSTNIDYFNQGSDRPTPGAPNPGLTGTTIINVSNTTVAIFGVTNQVWRWDNSGTDYSNAWRQVSFNDTGWSNGLGLFGFETTPQIYSFPFNTYIPPPPTNGGQITVYYRTHFQWTNLPGFALVASNYVDDGAVFYLNNTEVARLRITANPVLYGTLASNSGEPALDVTNLSTAALVNGDNVLAVEVHQSAANSSDDVFGMSLTAVRSLTNIIIYSVPVVLNEVLASNGSYTNADGTLTDWIELYNPSTNTTDLAGLSLSDDVAVPDKWIFPAGVTLAPGAYVVVRCDEGAPASTSNEPTLNTGFALNAAGDEVYLFDSVAHGGAQLDAVLFGIQASDFSIGRIPNANGPWALNIPTPGAANLAAGLGNVNFVRINEWLANPKTGDDDYIELYNPNTQPVAIGGLFLTDNLINRTKHPIAPLSFIGSYTNGFAKFIADGLPGNGPNHLGFGLDQDGESIGLFPSGNGPAIDAIPLFGAQDKDVSQGRLPDGGTNIVKFLKTQSPGEANYLPLETVVINEALTHSDPPLEDAIELFNKSADAVNVGGWFLSDSRNDLRKYRIPDNTLIAGGGFLVVYESQFNPNPGFAPNFALSSAHGDQVVLSEADGLANFTGFRDVADFGAAENGVSFGRFETSEGIDFTAMTARSFGQDNPTNLAQFRLGTGAANPPPGIGPVVINEILYHPPDIGTNDNVIDEFIELRNITAAPVPLFHPAYTTNTWKLRDAVTFTFPMNVTIPANGYLLLVSFDPTNAAQLAAFRAKYGIAPAIPVHGPYLGKLENDDDSVELTKADDVQLPPADDAGFVPRVLVDKAHYRDSAPWASLADGSTNGVGYSLQRRVSSSYGNEATNWLAGAPTPGAANGPAAATPPSISTQPQNQTAPAGSTVQFSVVAAGAEPLAFQWRFNRQDLPSQTNSMLQLTNVQTAHEGRYDLLVSNPSGAARSIAVTLTLQTPPLITQQPQGAVVALGQTAAFAVTATGSAPLRYQWRKDGANLSGRTNLTLTITNAQLSNQGSYTIVITNNYGAVTSTVAALTINASPVITAPPQDSTVTQGATATFNVSAVGSLPLRYRWRFNGANIANETNASLVLSNVQTFQAGNYTVVITNGVGSITSVVARLTVIPLPTVTVTATDSSAAEAGLATGIFTITRSYSTNTPLAVNFSISGTASNGLDYSTLAGPVTIPANAASQTVTVAPIDDALLEFPETVVLTLTVGADYILGSPGNATVTIADNDNLVPSVAITNLTNGTLFLISPTNIVIGAHASDSDGTVTKVEFFRQGTNKLGEASTAPYAITWSNAPAGSNGLTAVATDNFGGQATSPLVSILLNAPPTVSITNPPNNSSFTAPANITLNATAADADGTVTQVSFSANGTNFIGADLTAPFSVTWSNVPLGSYAIQAQAFDNRGANRVSTVVNVTVAEFALNLMDDFADRQTVTSLTNRISGANTGASKETGEPNHGSNAGGNSVWIAWTAPESGSAVADTFGSSFDTTLGVYRGTNVNALTSVAQNDNANGSTVQSRVTFTATAGVTYNIAVDGRRRNGNTPTGTIQLNFGLPGNLPPSISTQPQSRTVQAGSNVTFTVVAGGTAPLAYRWRWNGATIPGASAISLNLTNVLAFDEGTYSVVITNAFGSVTSSGAILTVDDALVGTGTVNLLPIFATWKYDQSGVDRGTAWRAPAFNDTAWPAGPALLGFDDSVPYPYFAPMATPLVPPLQGGSNTVYFRTHFAFTNEGTVIGLVCSNYVDDGAVWYLNGAEADRLRLPAGQIDFNTLAQTPPQEGVPGVLAFPVASLLFGDNVMAVEVHQSSTNSSDVVFGMTLDATISSTNRPVITNARILVDGRFQGTLVGVAGHIYAVEMTSALGANWSMLASFSNFTGQITFVDPPTNSGARFYRGRLIQ